jgi:hypothetical protein
VAAVEDELTAIKAAFVHGRIISFSTGGARSLGRPASQNLKAMKEY